MILSALNRPEDALPLIIAYAIIVLLAFPLHEFAHAWMAVQLGDVTPLAQGRLTLNPRAHIDPLGALLLAVGSFGWAKPVQFNPGSLRKAPSLKTGIVLVALAGPLMNLLIAFLAALPLRVGGVDFIRGTGALAQILFTIVIINIFLALFNMIPLVPLDGSKVLWGLMPYSWSRTYEQVQQYSFYILILLIIPFGGASLLSRVIDPVATALRQLLVGF